MSREQFVTAFESELPRGTHSVLMSEQTAPQATWAETTDIVASNAMAYAPQNPAGKILVGALGPKLIGIEDPRHVLTVAGSQTGKSVMLTANLLCTTASVICTDIKGELANRTARRRMEMGQDVYVLDPFEITSGHAAMRRAQFNPLAILSPYSASIIEDAGALPRRWLPHQAMRRTHIGMSPPATSLRGLFYMWPLLHNLRGSGRSSQSMEKSRRPSLPSPVKWTLLAILLPRSTAK